MDYDPPQLSVEARAVGLGAVLRAIGAEHRFAHELLDGLTGLEIGADAHNPFGLRTRNVASAEGAQFYAEEQRAMGVEPAGVNIWAMGG